MNKLVRSINAKMLVNIIIRVFRNFTFFVPLGYTYSSHADKKNCLARQIQTIGDRPSPKIYI